MDNLILNYEISNLIKRLQHGFINFLANSGMEWWGAGIAAAPTGWNVYGATCARSATAASGTYSAQITFSNSGQAFWTSIGPWGRYGVYTYSMYYQCLSGSGKAWFVAQNDDGGYEIIESLELDNTADGDWRLATISFTVPVAYVGRASRFGIISADANASVWLVDECMCQEGLNLASTWTNAPLWDTGTQGVFGWKYFMAGFGALSPSPPAAANSTGTKGQIEWDADYLYLCVDTDTWVSFKKDASWKP